MRVVVDAQHVDRTADADESGRNAHADHHQVFPAGGLHRDIVAGSDGRVRADMRIGGVGCHVDANGGRDADETASDRAGHGQVVKVVARADQHRLSRVDVGVVADIGFGGRVVDVDAG